MNIVFLGAPGSGKGTQAKILSEEYDLISIATGELLRKEVSRKTKLGREARVYLDKGELVPDKIVIGIVKECLGKLSKGFILDGFPRNLLQAKALEKILRALEKFLTAVFYFEVSEDELVKRLVNRRVCIKCGQIYHLIFNPPQALSGKCDFCGQKLYQRSDDKTKAIKRRLKVYLKETAPLISYYQNRSLLKVIKGEDSPQKISEAIQKALSRKGSSRKVNDYSKILRRA